MKPGSQTMSRVRRGKPKRVYGIVALKLGLRAAGFKNKRFMNDGDPKYLAQLHELRRVLPNALLLDRLTGEPLRQRAPKAGGAPALRAPRLNKQTRPLGKVLHALDSAKVHVATSGARESVCAVVSAGGSDAKRYLDYSAEVLLLRTAPSGTVVVRGEEGTAVVRAWIGVGTPRGDPTHKRSFGELGRVFIQRGFDDGFL